MYYHVIREGSITNTHSLANMRDMFIANMARQKDLVSYGYSEDKISICGPAIGLLSVTSCVASHYIGR